MNDKYLKFLLLNSHNLGLIVTFEDGDQYKSSSLVVWGENDQSEFEISVDYKDCIGHSDPLKTEQSSKLKYSDVYDGFVYNLEDVQSIFDPNKNYFVFERSDS